MAHDLIEIDKAQIQPQDESLTEYFKVEEHESEWRYFCKKCKKAWKVSKESIESNSANYFFLLNHGRSHLRKAKVILEDLKLKTQ